MMAQILHKLAHVVSFLVIIVLAVLSFAAVGGIVLQASSLRIAPWLPRPTEFTPLLDDILIVFILIELIKTATAYLLEQDVIHTIFETALVAVVRKLIVSAAEPLSLEKACGLSILTISIGVSWYLAYKSHPKFDEDLSTSAKLHTQKRAIPKETKLRQSA